MTSEKDQKQERSSQDDAPQSKRQRQAIEELPDDEMEEVSLLNSSNDAKENTDQSKLDKIQSIQAKLLVLQNSIKQEMANLVKLGVHVSPITIACTPPTFQEAEESNPLKPIPIIQEVEETIHPSSDCSESCLHGNFPNSFLPKEMLDGIKLLELIDKSLDVYNNSASNKHLGKSMDDLMKKTIHTEGGGLYEPIYDLWQRSDNKYLLKDKGIIDGLNRTMEECGNGFIPNPFNCKINGKKKVVPFIGNFTGLGAMKTWEMLIQVIAYLGEDVGTIVLNFCAYAIGDPLFLDYQKEIARLIRKLQPFLGNQEFKHHVKMIEKFNTTLDTISYCCRKTHEYLYAAVCQYIAISFNVPAVINFSTPTGRRVFGGTIDPFESIGFSDTVKHDNEFHLCHLLLKKSEPVTKENFQRLFLTGIVLHATSSDLDVIQVLEELKNEETAEKHVRNILEILKTFAYPNTRTTEFYDYYLMTERSRKLTILSKYIEQMKRTSNQSISREYIAYEIRTTFDINSKYIYPFEKCINSIEVNGSQIPCPNICVSEGLCGSCKKFGKCIGHDDDGVKCGKNATSIERLCDLHKFGKCIHKEKGLQCMNYATSSDHLCEDHKIDYCDRGCGNLGTVCAEMITLNIEAGSLGIDVRISDIDILLIGRVQSDSQFAGIAKAGDIILSHLWT